MVRVLSFLSAVGQDAFAPVAPPIVTPAAAADGTDRPGKRQKVGDGATCTEETKSSGVKNEDAEDESDEGDLPTGMVLGNRDVWPYYWRLMFIAAYRRIQSLEADSVEGLTKEYILRSLLAACPAVFTEPDDDDSYDMNIVVARIVSAVRNPPPVKLKQLLSKEIIPAMCAAGLGPVIWFARLHCSVSQEDIPPHFQYMDNCLIRQAHVMLELLLPFMAKTKEALAGTPYAVEFEHSHYNIADDDRMDSLLSHFRRAASKPDVYGIIE